MYRDKKDKLDALILLAGDVLVEKNLNTDLLDGAPVVNRPKSLDRKIARMIQHERRKPYNEVFVILKQTAAVFLVVCTLILAMAMSVEAVREAFWNAVVEWFDKYISVVYECKADPPDVIEEYKEPQLVPVGAERVNAVKDKHGNIIYYYIKNNIVLTFRQTIFNANKRHYDDKVKEWLEVNINNNKGYISVNQNGRCTLCWTDSKYLYEILFDEKMLNLSLVINIAESLE